MRQSSSCSPRTLASSDVVRVDLCDHCGIFVVHVGPVSLRVERGALDSLSTTVAEALRLISEPPADERGECEERQAVMLNPAWAPRGRA